MAQSHDQLVQSRSRSHVTYFQTVIKRHFRPSFDVSSNFNTKGKCFTKFSIEKYHVIVAHDLKRVKRMLRPFQIDVFAAKGLQNRIEHKHRGGQKNFIRPYVSLSLLRLL